MDFGISTVFKIIGKGISIAKAIWKMINDLIDLQDRRQELQRQIRVLHNILESMKSVDTLKDPRVARELHKALSNLDYILEDIGEACASFDFGKAIEMLKSFTGKDKKFLERLLNKLKQAKEVASIALTAEKKAEVLSVLDQHLKLALSLVQIGFSCTQVRQIRYIETSLSTGFHDLNLLTDDKLDVYSDPDGELPKPVSDVKAKVNGQRLIVSWEGDKGVAKTKYEVRYHETKYLTVMCEKSPIAFGSQRITPWRDYAIQVRSVNDTGASNWSYPPFYIRMNEGAPSPPGFVIFEATGRHSLSVIAETAPEEQGVTHMIVEKLKKGKANIQWEQEESKCYEHTLTGLDRVTEYLLRVRFRNKFDVGAPSAMISVKIENMLPNEPTKFELFPGDGVKPEIRFKPSFINPGAVNKYKVELIKTTRFDSKTVIMEIDGGKEPDRESGLIKHSFDGITVDSLADYKMSVHAVAKRGAIGASGHLSLSLPKHAYVRPLTISSTTLGAESTFMVADKDLEISTTFADSD